MMEYLDDVLLLGIFLVLADIRKLSKDSRSYTDYIKLWWKNKWVTQR